MPTDRKAGVYLETTIISYLAARPSRDKIVMAHQRITANWWRDRRAAFRLLASSLVWAEAERGDAEAAARRLRFLREVKRLELNDASRRLAGRFVARGVIPAHAAADGLHIAAAAIHGLEFLMTWNCAHINNALMVGRIRTVCESAGFRCPVICTPEELMGA